LADSLAALNRQNAHLEKVKDQAEHAARLFKELADQSKAQNQDPTNTYPTPRHLYAGLGKQTRLVAEIQAKWGDVEEDKLPPDEQKAMQQAMLVIMSEMVRLKQAAAQLKGDESQDVPQPATPEAMADYSSCY